MEAEEEEMAEGSMRKAEQVQNRYEYDEKNFSLPRAEIVRNMRNMRENPKYAI